MRKRLVSISLALLVAAVVALLITPFVVARGLRLWLLWNARQQNLIVRIDKIDAPLFRPVVLRGIHITSAPANPVTVTVDANQGILSLNLKALVLRQRERAVSSLVIDTLQAETRRPVGGKLLSRSGWSALQKILPGKLSVGRCDLRMEDGPSVFLLRGASLSASEIEAGKFEANEITVVSPWFRQSFEQLRGATNWQDNRLTLAGLSLARGLDLPWIWIDLSQLAQQRVDVDFDLDAFGGKIRAEISDDWGRGGPTWNIAGSATDISLAQTSEALGFTDRIDGALHAGKFVFRGNRQEPTHATASLWTELTNLSWRNRAAEVIMLGASLYNRNIDLQQLYVKQGNNQLTLNGQAALPEKPSGWLSPSFRGNISASIDKLGDFVPLFGANPGDFAGAMSIEGTMDTRDRKIGGRVTCSGTALTIFKTAIDSFRANLSLNAGDLAVEQLELKRKNDLLSATGNIGISRNHIYSGELHAKIADLADYLSIFRGLYEQKTKPTAAEIDAKITSGKWATHGTLVFPGSSPVTFSADFLLPIGTTWNRFAASPLGGMITFPSLFLGSTPPFFPFAFFRDGILSGGLSISESLRHPRITGDVQLLNGKLENPSLNLREANGRITFAGNHAIIEFLNASTKDVDLSLHGEIDFRDSNALAVKINPVMPMFYLTTGALDCINQIEIEPVGTTLAPAVTELDLRGTLFGSTWTLGVKQQTVAGSAPGLSLADTGRNLVLCLGQGLEDKKLALGAPPRPQPSPAKPRGKKRNSAR